MTKIVKLSVIAILSLSAVSQAKEQRNQSWEFFLSPIFTQSKVLEFEKGAKADINSRGGLGFGFGYNVNPNIELTMLFSASSGNYNGTRVKEDGSKESFTSNMYTNSINFGGTYHFLEGAFTPYASGTFGFTYIDSGIVVEGGSGYCYWDPWWGYVCDSTTYTDTVLNYGGSVGLRYDFGNGLFLKGGVGISYLDIDSTNSSDFIVYDFSIGSTF
ncbi:MAG: outer membrane beta-barrel protein [Campylobacterota bacterium]|nr:outer membrane beta-barrel protein [Campylobacterota bacterium]